MTGNTRNFRPRKAISYDNTAFCPCDDNPYGNVEPKHQSGKTNKWNRSKHNSDDLRQFIERKKMLATEEQNAEGNKPSLKLDSGDYEDLRQYIVDKMALKEQQNSRLRSNDRSKSKTIRRSGCLETAVLEAFLKELTITDESEPRYGELSCKEGRQDVTNNDNATNDVGGLCYEAVQQELLTGLIMSTSETVAPADYRFHAKMRNELKMRNSVLKEFRYHPYA